MNSNAARLLGTILITTMMLQTSNAQAQDQQPEMISDPIVQQVEIPDVENDEAFRPQFSTSVPSTTAVIAPSSPSFTVPVQSRFFVPCNNTDKPCIRVFGNPGDEFWIIPTDTFDAWKISQSRRDADVRKRIAAASSFAFHNWETETIGIDGYYIPDLGEVGISYLIVPKCFDRNPSGNFRYEHRRELMLRGGGELRHTLRCSWS